MSGMQPPTLHQPLYNQPAAIGFPVNRSDFESPITQSQLPSPYPLPKVQHDWSTGLFDCFSDFQNCCTTCWCPCATFGQVADIVDQGSTAYGVSGALYTLFGGIVGCGCLYSCFYRSKMRRQYMLKEDRGDCLVHCCCERCALCQEYRELENHGFEMVIGI